MKPIIDPIPVKKEKTQRKTRTKTENWKRRVVIAININNPFDVINRGSLRAMYKELNRRVTNKRSEIWFYTQKLPFVWDGWYIVRREVDSGKDV